MNAMNLRYWERFSGCQQTCSWYCLLPVPRLLWYENWQMNAENMYKNYQIWLKLARQPFREKQIFFYAEWEWEQSIQISCAVKDDVWWVFRNYAV